MKAQKMLAALFLLPLVGSLATFTSCDGPGPVIGPDTGTVTPPDTTPTEVTLVPIPTTIEIPEGALTISQAIELCASLENAKDNPDAKVSDKVYVHGWVKKLHNKHADGVTSYGNAQFYMSEEKYTDNTYKSDDILAYQVYGLEGQKLTSADQVEEGDYVVIYGPLTNYDGTYETVGKGAAHIYASTNPKLSQNNQGEPENTEVKDVTIAEAIKIAEALEAGTKTTVNYRVVATLTRVSTAEADVAKYGNINITLKDETGTISSYYTNNIGNTAFTSADQVPAVGSVLKIVGPLKAYVNKNTEEVTPEFENAWIEEVVSQGEGNKVVDGGTVTVAEFLTKEDSDEVWYTLSGNVENLVNTDYGNFDLTDETGTVYVYGLTETQQLNLKNDKSFSKLGIQEGDFITIKGTKSTFKGKIEVNCAYLIEKI